MSWLNIQYLQPHWETIYLFFLKKKKKKKDKLYSVEKGKMVES